MTALVKYDAACRAVAEAASIDEAKEFRDQSEAMRAYARQAKNKQMETQAAEIRFRAERRIGELMAAQREGGHMASAGRPSQEIGSRTNPISKPPTLEEVGIDKKTADRARKYAAIPEDEFNGIVGEWRERVEAENARVTVDLLAAGKKAEAKRDAAPEIEDAAPEPEPAPDPYGYSKLTEAALLDTANGLRVDLDEAKAALKKAKAERDDFKARWQEATAEEMGRALGNAQRARDTAKGRLGEEQAKNARQGKRIKLLEAEVAKLRKQVEDQEVPL